MSASMYNSPYTFREAQPRIEYPSLFSGLKGITFRFALDSKILALSVLILLISFVVVVGMAITPFWFQLVLSTKDGTFGGMPVKRELTINTGLFFIHEDHFDNLASLDRLTGRDVVPKVVAAAQTFSVLGNCLLLCCLVGSVILVLRRFASTTAVIMLALATSLCAFAELLTIIFCVALVILSSCDAYANDNCVYSDNLEWQMIPIYSQMYRVEPSLTPFVKPNWAFYIAILGALMVVGAAVMLWIEAFMTIKNLGGIRYQQLRQVRDPYENDIDPSNGRKYVYAPPVQSGPNMYGMQPVVSAAAYSGAVIHKPVNVGFQYSPPATAPTVSYGPTRRGGPPSTHSSTSEPYMSREIDL